MFHPGTPRELQRRERIRFDDFLMKGFERVVLLLPRRRRVDEPQARFRQSADVLTRGLELQAAGRVHDRRDAGRDQVQGTQPDSSIDVLGCEYFVNREGTVTEPPLEIPIETAAPDYD